MYGEVVDGIDGHRFEQALGDLKRERGVQQDVDLTADDLARLDRDVQGDLPAGDRRRVSAGRARAAAPRGARRLRVVAEPARAGLPAHVRDPDDIGTAVNVVQMVFGNKGDRSATGVCFTRDPSTGEQGLYGEYLVNAQGEDVVAGIRTPQPIEEMRERLPEAFDQLLETMTRLEQHYRDMQDIEFTVEEGRLYLLQTRSAKRTAAAALKAAVDMTGGRAHLARGRDRAHRPGQLDQLSASDARPEGRVRGRGARAQRVAGRGVRRDRPRRRHGRGARARRASR